MPFASGELDERPRNWGEIGWGSKQANARRSTLGWRRVSVQKECVLTSTSTPKKRGTGNLKERNMNTIARTMIRTAFEQQQARLTQQWALSGLATPASMRRGPSAHFLLRHRSRRRDERVGWRRALSRAGRAHLPLSYGLIKTLVGFRSESGQQSCGG